jgi:hypothetical protein
MFDGEYSAQFRESWRHDEHTIVIEYTKGRPGYTWHIHAMLETQMAGIDLWRGSYEARNAQQFAEMLRMTRVNVGAKLEGIAARVQRLDGGSHVE